MSMNNDMQQIVAELHKIQDRWDEYCAKDAEYKELEEEQEEAEQKVTRKWVDAGDKFNNDKREKLPKRPKLPTGWSKTIPTPVLLDWEDPKKTIILTAASRLLSSYGLLAAIALIFGGGFIGTILVIVPFIGKILSPVVNVTCYLLGFALFAGCVINAFCSNTDANKQNIQLCLALGKPSKENAEEEWSSKFNAGITNEAIENFYKEFKNYDTEFLSYVDTCKKKAKEIVSDYGNDRKATTRKYLEMRQAKLDEITPILNEISNQSLLHSDYVPYAGSLARLIESGRADTIKEAINTMLDDIRKDKEEEERREEAHRQEVEARRHNMAMQRIAEQEARDARAHNEAMERAARDQASAAKAQADAAQRAANDARMQAQRAEKERRNQEYNARNDALRRCQGCINSAKCAHKGIVNCAAFRPR